VNPPLDRVAQNGERRARAIPPSWRFDDRRRQELTQLRPRRRRVRPPRPGSRQAPSLVGIEGGQAIENSLGMLRMLHALGATPPYQRNTERPHEATWPWPYSARTAAVVQVEPA
jgi:hypothetical protein